VNSQNGDQLHKDYQDKETFDKRHYIPQMEIILRGIISAYNLMMLPHYSMIENHEEKITGRLYIDFLDDDDFRGNLDFGDYHFFPETPSYNEEFKQIGYSDIRVRVTKKMNAFNTTKADYIIECKRLDGGLSLNREYLKEGIMRFVDEKYTAQNKHNVSAMLGFVVRKIEILKNITKINQLAIDENIGINTISHLDFFQIDDVFKESYQSKHTTISNKEAKIYHLMLDFSDKIIT
jgi:hypothetical protein